jgi:cytochrome c-550 PedF
MKSGIKLTTLASSMLLSAVISSTAWAHGDVTPQNVDVSSLPALGEAWTDRNPYGKEDNDNFDQGVYDEALRVGASAYNQNCARCHGLEAISGGIAPDLRYLEAGYDGDEWYKERVINGAVRDGRVYMPKMADYIPQEALWAIRTWVLAQPAD